MVAQASLSYKIFTIYQQSHTSNKDFKRSKHCLSTITSVIIHLYSSLIIEQLRFAVAEPYPRQSQVHVALFMRSSAATVTHRPQEWNSAMKNIAPTLCDWCFTCDRSVSPDVTVTLPIVINIRYIIEEGDSLLKYLFYFMLRCKSVFVLSYSF